MKKEFQLRFFILALLSVTFMICIGIMVAQRSVLGILSCTLLLFATIGYAFTQKKKQRIAK